MGDSGKSTVSRLAIVLVVFLLLVLVIVVTLIVLHYVPVDSHGDGYLIGVGRADCTGPVAEVPFMGYANSEQTGAGIISRLYCRAFIIAEPDNWNKRLVFVSAEIAMISQRIRLEVKEQLKQKYGDLYRIDNVILSATHTHSGPGAYFQNTLFIIAGKGLIKPSLHAIVNGIVESIDMAHKNMMKGRILINKGILENSQINRSPFSYLHNPESERYSWLGDHTHSISAAVSPMYNFATQSNSRDCILYLKEAEMVLSWGLAYIGKTFRYSSNTDKEMVLLKMISDKGQDIGMLSWYAIHPVSMNNTNRLVCSDNVGYAAYLFEQEMNKGYLTGKGPYVAAFASSNLGDVSPNTKGPHCINTGESCENLHSYCPIGGAKMCIATGPGKNMFESTQLIGRNIYLKAKELFMTASEEINGPIASAHQWVNMANVTVQLNATHSVKTCKPALGYSFAGGTVDGPGMFNFTQGAIEGDPFWDTVRNVILTEPSNETVECHKPKPILIPTGELSKPYPWQSEIIDVQLATIGSLAILAIPGELTTMAGRRLREAVKSEFQAQQRPGMNVVLSGLSSIYTHYITTYEEYQVQRYEGGANIFGPHSLSAYIQLFTAMVEALVKGQALLNSPEPTILNITDLNFLPSVMDSKPLGQQFGDVLQDAQTTYRVGEVAKVKFVSANPRNSAENMRNFTFLTVEKYNNATEKWQVLYEDGSWDTRFLWEKGSWGRSTATIEWHIPNYTDPGTYVIKYFGHSKELLKPIVAFNGSSSTFEVSN